MWTVFVPTAGSDSVAAVFATALAAARPPRAHFEFLHMRIRTAEAAVFTPHLKGERRAVDWFPARRGHDHESFRHYDARRTYRCR